ncbi:hypothetical protein Ddc_07299 [Ditylenchus destructor]|nr:hypothetical protein Ddc_07299 [Ditylenchus destructor]
MKSLRKKLVSIIRRDPDTGGKSSQSPIQICKDDKDQFLIAEKQPNYTVVISPRPQPHYRHIVRNRNSVASSPTLTLDTPDYHQSSNGQNEVMQEESENPNSEGTRICDEQCCSDRRPSLDCSTGIVTRLREHFSQISESTAKPVQLSRMKRVFPSADNLTIANRDNLCYNANEKRNNDASDSSTVSREETLWKPQPKMRNTVGTGGNSETESRFSPAEARYVIVRPIGLESDCQFDVTEDDFPPYQPNKQCMEINGNNKDERNYRSIDERNVEPISVLRSKFERHGRDAARSEKIASRAAHVRSRSANGRLSATILNGIEQFEGHLKSDDKAEPIKARISARAVKLENIATPPDDPKPKLPDEIRYASTIAGVNGWQCSSKVEVGGVSNRFSSHIEDPPEEPLPHRDFASDKQMVMCDQYPRNGSKLTTVPVNGHQNALTEVQRLLAKFNAKRVARERNSLDEHCSNLDRENEYEEKSEEQSATGTSTSDISNASNLQQTTSTEASALNSERPSSPNKMSSDKDLAEESNAGNELSLVSSPRKSLSSKYLENKQRSHSSSSTNSDRSDLSVSKKDTASYDLAQNSEEFQLNTGHESEILPQNEENLRRYERNFAGDSEIKSAIVNESSNPPPVVVTRKLSKEMDNATINVDINKNHKFDDDYDQASPKSDDFELDLDDEMASCTTLPFTMIASDGNPVRHSLLSLADPEDIPDLLAAMAEEHHFVFEDYSNDMDSTCGIIHRSDNDKRKPKNESCKIKFMEEPPTVFAYLDENSLEEGEWQLGCSITFDEYQKMTHDVQDQAQQDHLELARWRQAMQDMYGELRENALNYPISHLIISHNKEAMAKCTSEANKLENP